LMNPMRNSDLGHYNAAPLDGEPLWVLPLDIRTKDREPNQDKDTFSLWSNKCAPILRGSCVAGEDKRPLGTASGSSGRGFDTDKISEQVVCLNLLARELATATVGSSSEHAVLPYFDPAFYNGSDQLQHTGGISHYQSCMGENAAAPGITNDQGCMAENASIGNTRRDQWCPEKDTQRSGICHDQQRKSVTSVKVSIGGNISRDQQRVAETATQQDERARENLVEQLVERVTEMSPPLRGFVGKPAEAQPMFNIRRFRYLEAPRPDVERAHRLLSDLMEQGIVRRQQEQ